MPGWLLILIFVVAAIVGYFIINKVPTLLHTPHKSGMNALSGITVLCALTVLAVALKEKAPVVSVIIGVAAIVEKLLLPTSLLNIFLYGASVNANLSSGITALIVCIVVSVGWAIIYNLLGTRILSKSDVY